MVGFACKYISHTHIYIMIRRCLGNKDYLIVPNNVDPK